MDICAALVKSSLVEPSPFMIRCAATKIYRSLRTTMAQLPAIQSRLTNFILILSIFCLPMPSTAKPLPTDIPALDPSSKDFSLPPAINIFDQNNTTNTTTTKPPRLNCYHYWDAPLLRPSDCNPLFQVLTSLPGYKTPKTYSYDVDHKPPSGPIFWHTVDLSCAIYLRIKQRRAADVLTLEQIVEAAWYVRQGCQRLGNGGWAMVGDQGFYVSLVGREI